MRYSEEQLRSVKEIDLLSYLKAYEPGNLRHLGRNDYCLRDHDSLKISNGKWFWFSRNTGGHNALDYLIKVRGYSFPDAVRQLSPEAGIPVCEYIEPERRERKLQLPEFENGIPKAAEYLRKRGISSEVIEYCHEKELLFEDRKYHSCIFLGYDGSTPKFGMYRSTTGDAKRDLAGSDKHYSFCIPAEGETGTVHVFEAAIDALSYATMDPYYHETTLLSLSGVSAGGTRRSIPMALKTFLGKNPQIKTLVLHLDNDEVGRAATQKLFDALYGKYELIDGPPGSGKDWNDFLQNEIKKRKEMTR